MRITTSTIMRQYNSRLNSVLKNVNNASSKVTSGRKFERASEDPSSSVKSYKLRREFLKNEDYKSNLEDTKELFKSYESSMMQVSNMATDAHVDILTAINGTMSYDERTILANKLREMQKTMTMDMNVSIGGQFIFAGTGNKSAPFELTDDGKLTYRGLDVNDPANQTKLEELAKEHVLVDLGFGLETQANAGGTGTTIAPDTAFNKAIPGISFLGYGNDADGNSQNIITLLGEVANALDQPDDTYDIEAVKKLNTKFDVKRNEAVVSLTQMGSNTMFLDYTEKRLEDAEYNLTLSIQDVEYMDSAKAITDFKMQDYIYRAALQMGMNVLSPSFIDFMR